jgi:hypothetical protein
VPTKVLLLMTIHIMNIQFNVCRAATMPTKNLEYRMKDIGRDTDCLATEVTRHAPTHGATGDQSPLPLKSHDVHLLAKLTILNLLVTVLDALPSAPSSWQHRNCDMPWNEKVLEIFTIFGVEPTMSCH